MDTKEHLQSFRTLAYRIRNQLPSQGADVASLDMELIFEQSQIHFSYSNWFIGTYAQVPQLLGCFAVTYHHLDSAIRLRALDRALSKSLELFAPPMKELLDERLASISAATRFSLDILTDYYLRNLSCIMYCNSFSGGQLILELKKDAVRESLNKEIHREFNDLNQQIPDWDVQLGHSMLNEYHYLKRTFTLGSGDENEANYLDLTLTGPWLENLSTKESVELTALESKLTFLLLEAGDEGIESDKLRDMIYPNDDDKNALYQAKSQTEKKIKPLGITVNTSGKWKLIKF